MSYNIHHANPPSKAGLIDVDAIAAVINKYKPDVVALQEVDVNTKRSGMNEAVVLAEKTKMNFYFAKAIDHEGGDYGVAILSRYSLSGGTTHKLPTAEGTKGEPRVLATAIIEVNGKKLVLACTHLDAQRNDTNRVLQINAITGILQQETNPVVLAGDLNATPGGAVINTLDQHFTRTCTQNCGFTIPQVNPTKTIDFIAYKPSTNFTVLSHTVIDEQYASDHLPVIVTLKIFRE
ncbi:endonuclease [Paraflavitalea soli]|uniref:Endonuclease n=2 Tax=Paraflavitalea soli TaxID=2315862 RepID=A0A3B7MYE5_9BACT|nr:endonuclease [Paraflavitalea soli]